MSLFKLFIVLFFTPFLLFSSSDSNYAYSFAGKLNEQDYEECYRLIEEWERANPDIFSHLKALKGMVKLAEGKLNECRKLMDESLEELKFQGIPEETLQFITLWYEKALYFEEDGERTDSIHLSLNNSSPQVFLCKKKQPKGVRFKYWLGVAQIVAGCVIAPFSGGAGGALILSGVAIAGSATADSLNNMEEWERNLDDRQRMDPDDTPPTQNNSFNSLSLWDPAILVKNKYFFRFENAA
ncbi:MAG: hypothetical protein K1060chlam2_00649 [Chlamydiae bacterium]|nr:hypothetical protein [Chlamydiota bacterium]